MEANLGARVHELVELGWEPLATTDTTAALVGRRPFNWWLFIFVLFFFPLFGGVLYLIFHMATSRATVFLHVESDGVVTAGDTWLVAWQTARRDAYVERQKKIKERGFLAVMWPQLLVSLVLLVGWLILIKWYFGAAA
jgi:hypothetical protein